MLPWLDSRGHPQDKVEEEIVVIQAPMHPMTANKGMDAVRDTDVRLIDDVLEFFSFSLDAYIDSWRALDSEPRHVGRTSTRSVSQTWEVIIPPEAVLKVEVVDE